MRAGKYSIRDFFVNRYVDQIIIPEIQRDYVWRQEQLLGLLNSINANFQQFLSVRIPEIRDCNGQTVKNDLINDFEGFYKRRNCSSSVGFVYAYSDPQYEGRYFLIDGQQRITSLYLLLVKLASRLGKSNEFIKYYFYKGRPKLDYRVRSSASKFLYNLVMKLLEDPGAEITDELWYLKTYVSDKTISSILQNLEHIDRWLEETNNLSSEFYDYLCEYTELWYFDTNISSQGESLYIYLNARGESVQGNENLKAELLSQLEDSEKNKQGKVWEHWQDFFWRQRNSGKNNNANADEGFNEFLACLTGLSLFLKNSEDRAWYEKFGRDVEFPSSALQAETLNINFITQYVECLQLLESIFEEMNKIYSYSDWIHGFWKDLWSLFNNEKTGWVLNYSNDLHSKERNRMVFVWGVLHWVNSSRDVLDTVTIFRGVRQFYLRYKNNNRALVGDSGVMKSISSLLKTGFISSSEDREEYIKERWLAAIADENHRRNFESEIWEIEDHPYNLDGSDVGMTNISHLVDFQNEITIERLRRIKAAFCECFPVEKASRSMTRNFGLMQSVLLYYGEFWLKKWTNGYENYQFDDWKRNIRPLLSGQRATEFIVFLDEFIDSGLDLKSFLESKRTDEPSRQVDDFRGQLKWYNFHIKEAMWDKGGHIALNYDYSSHLRDVVFTERQPFFNTNGGFRSQSNELSKKLPEQILRTIQKGKDCG